MSFYYLHVSQNRSRIGLNCALYDMGDDVLTVHILTSDKLKLRVLKLENAFTFSSYSTRSFSTRSFSTLESSAAVVRLQ